MVAHNLKGCRETSFCIISVANRNGRASDQIRQENEAHGGKEGFSVADAMRHIDTCSMPTRRKNACRGSHNQVKLVLEKIMEITEKRISEKRPTHIFHN